MATDPAKTYHAPAVEPDWTKVLLLFIGQPS
jgi:hypothetical protein